MAKVKKVTILSEYQTVFSEDEVVVLLAALRYKRTHQLHHNTMQTYPVSEELIHNFAEVLNNG